jgi:hypothetical protein
MSRTAGYTIVDKKRNEHILTELQVEPINAYLQQYRAQWKTHIKRMTDSKWTELITSYKSQGRRSLKRPLKRRSETLMDH